MIKMSDGLNHGPAGDESQSLLHLLLVEVLVELAFGEAVEALGAFWIETSGEPVRLMPQASTGGIGAALVGVPARRGVRVGCRIRNLDLDLLGLLPATPGRRRVAR
jgi:hypothetical protein